MEGKEFNVTVALDQRLGQDGKSAYELWKEQGNEGSVAYLVYMGEPAQLQRKQIGYGVLLFLFAIMLPLAYFLKKEYWKDVH